MSNQFEAYLQQNGISHVPGPPHSPQINGVAERTNRTIGNLIRCALVAASLPKSFWADALRHAFFPFDSYPCTTPLGFLTPNSILGYKETDLTSLHPFGCLAWYKLPEAERKKLDPKARSSVLLSYLPDGKGFRLWDLECKVVIKSRDVIFDDCCFPYDAPLKSTPVPVRVELPWPKPSRSAPPVRTATPDLPLLDIPLQPRFDRRLTASIHNPANLTPPSSPSLPPTPPSSPAPTSPPPSPPAPPPVPRRSSRQTRPPDRLGNFAKSTTVDVAVEAPKTWKQLLKSPHKDQWLTAAEEEYTSLIGKETWRLVPRPLKRQIIKSK